MFTKLVYASLFLLLFSIPNLLQAQEQNNLGLPGGYGTLEEPNMPGMSGTYGLKIYRVDSILYPFVQVYFRTFDQNQQPLVNLNAMNIGLMVAGRAYDPSKRQYIIQSLRQRQEAIRSILLIDASKSVAGPPFEASLRAAARFIDGKRPQDEVAILATSDNKEGYEVISLFERDKRALLRRLMDLKPNQQHTRLYDSIGTAMEMCGVGSQGSVVQSSATYISSCSIVVFSDGNDDGSAVSRQELNFRITNLSIPIPIYSITYSKDPKGYFRNLEAISKNSFGIYYPVPESLDRMTSMVEQIQNILQSDYVVTFRSYIDADGNEKIFKLGVEYPSGSSRFTYETARFEAVEPPPGIPKLDQLIAGLEKTIERTDDPYLPRRKEASTPAPAPSQKKPGGWFSK